MAIHSGIMSLEIYEDCIAIITFHNADNRVNENFVNQLNYYLDTIENNQEISVLITTGHEKFYSNGLDLDKLLEHVDDLVYSQKFGLRIQALICRLLTFPIVTICALNGHAYALGAFMALCHDKIIMQTDRGYFCVNEIHLGTRIEALLTTLCDSKLPDPSIKRDVTIFGKKYNGTDALKSGIIHEICSADELMPRAKSIAKALAQHQFNRKAMELIKKDLYRNVLKLEKKLPMEELKSRM